MEFKGFTGTNIQYNEETFEWEMTNGPAYNGKILVYYCIFSFKKLSEINGTSTSSIQSMGTGTMKWNLNKVIYF